MAQSLQLQVQQERDALVGLNVPIVVRARWEVPRDVLRRGERDRGLLTAVRRAITTAGHTAIVSLHGKAR